ncbi:hypothetical protein VIBHAR_05052 [Vibrio campbellii ATCC BAA-1116]|uniref:Uncharacterized protein n=1 Tax=Vibrio campbellii (strain ATCC BAA-1116) TaxID=2902295 RepID=A7N232_VIBC1|nr:hypothetical protein VIBHAR_05052 [Vibrio campbellii ATCC BAA-1116]
MLLTCKTGGDHICEQRNTKATAYNHKHLTQRIVKMPRVANHS